MSDAEAILRWIVALTVVCAALAPVVWWLADGLGSVAHGVVRSLAPFIATAILWWPSALLGVPFSATTMGAVVILAGVVGWISWMKSGRRVAWQPIVAFEVLWLALFSGYAFFRTYHPAIANTEKPMDIALLSSISRSTSVPAPDPWFAGETINYYYLGYQVIGGIVKLSGVPPATAFNLALATLFASVGIAAVAIGYWLATTFGANRAMASVAGGLSVFLVLIAGNLETAWRILQQPGETMAAGWWYDGVGWQASRVIVDHGVHGNPAGRNTINEFPAFSFILGDLHPHVLTYPLLIGILALVTGVLCKPESLTFARTACIGALSGLLYASNSWDAPLGIGLLVVALLILYGWKSPDAWLCLGLAGVAALITTLPFLLNFTPPVGIATEDIPVWFASLPVIGTLTTSLGVVTWRPSSVGELLLVHGAWILGWSVFATSTLLHDTDTRKTLRVIAGMSIAGVLAIVWVPAVLLLGVPFMGSILIAAASRKRATRIIAGFFATGFLLTLIPEFFYIQDAFSDRMNTVFKLYFQAWLLLAVATGVSLVYVITNVPRRLGIVVGATGALLVLVVAPYAPISARDWTDNFASRQGLNGAVFIEKASPDEYAAIRWLAENADEDTTLVEAPGCSYGSVAGIPMSRFASFTGIPGLIGWDGHQRQWRRGEDTPIAARVTRRQAIANGWLSGSSQSTLDIPVPHYVILGLQERLGSASCEPLEAHDVERSRFALEAVGWQVVFSAGDIVILAHPQAEIDALLGLMP